MKRILSLVFMLVLLCGCGEKTVTPVTRQISFTAKITYYNEQFVCDTKVDKNGVTEMTVKSPDSLKGLCFTVSKDKTVAEFLGLTYTPQTEEMPYFIVTRTLFELLDTVSGKKGKCEEENCVISGKVGERPFDLTLAPTGLPICAEIPDDSFTVEFCNMTVTKK